MRSFYSLFLLLLSIFVFSQPISSKKAIEKAKKFYSEKQGKTLRTDKKFKITYRATSKNKNSENYYYVINVGNNEGFVIVSGDERIKPILGYSLNGNFDHNILDNVTSWMQQYEQQIDYVIKNNLSVKPIKETYTNTVEILPLIKTNWNQSKPYNNLCPTINTEKPPTGCVATATAQIMKYHDWPIKGMGSHTYTPPSVGIPITADFENTVYDWKNMRNMYLSNNLTVETDAVATLMYHVGVAVDMDYKVSESGAISSKVPSALINYFGYDENIQMYSRNYLNKEEWYKIIKDELAAKRPVYYAGRESSGHAFVCDGVDAMNYFHINWGWGGASDGYFTLENLIPNDLGTGGGAGNYNYDQEIIVGIQKPTSGNINTDPQLYLRSTIKANKETILRNEFFDISYGFINKGNTSFTEKVGIGLYQEGKLIKILSTSKTINLSPNYFYSDFLFSNTTISADIASGEYQLYAMAQNGNNWTQMKGVRPNYLQITVTDTHVNFTNVEIQVDLLLKTLPTIAKLYKDRNNKFNFSIHNNSDEYFADIDVKLISATGEMFSLGSKLINIIKDETISLEFITPEIKVETGTYTLQIFYYKNGIAVPFNINQKVEVINANPGNITLKNIESPSEIFLNEKLEITTIVNNSGGYFSGTLLCFFRPISDPSSYIYIRKNIIIDENSSETIVFTPEISSLSPGNYEFFFNLKFGDEQKFIGTMKNITLKEPIENKTICYKPGKTGTPSKSLTGISSLKRKNEDWINDKPNGALVLDSKEKGFVITRTNPATIVTPVEGMLIFNITENCLQLYNGTSWNCIEQTCVDN